MIDYFRSCSSNAHHVCCQDSPTKGLYDHCQSDDLDFHSRSRCVSNFDYFFNLQLLGQYFSYYIQTSHDGRLTYGLELDLDFENVSKARPTWVFFCLGGLFFAEKMRKSGFTTLLDPFHHRFGRVIGCLLYLPALSAEIFWSAAILNALGRYVPPRSGVLRIEI